MKLCSTIKCIYLVPEPELYNLSYSRYRPEVIEKCYACRNRMKVNQVPTLTEIDISQNEIPSEMSKHSKLVANK